MTDAGGSRHGRELLDPRVRTLVDEFEQVADRHGRMLSVLGFVGSIELNFSLHGYANSRLTLFLKPKRRTDMGSH